LALRMSCLSAFYESNTMRRNCLLEVQLALRSKSLEWDPDPIHGVP